MGFYEEQELRLMAEIGPRSIGDLDIKPGGDVVAAIKASVFMRCIEALGFGSHHGNV